MLFLFIIYLLRSIDLFSNFLTCVFALLLQRQVQPVSHLIISEDCQGSQLYQILQLLKRSNSPVPQQLKALIAGVKRVGIQTGKPPDPRKGKSFTKYLALFSGSFS